ncbi:MAG: DNA polymerase III subunit delta [Coriobacteriia bacterium]|nr:DNA polymerase III subunit delta [Coriobacteriia bacterium]
MTNAQNNNTAAVKSQTKSRAETGTKAKLQPINLIISQQDLLRNEAITRLRQRMVEEGVDLELDSQVIEAEQTDVGSFVSATATLPFLSPLRLVILQNIDLLRASDERMQAVIDYCENPNPTTVLAITANRLTKTTKLYKAVAKNGLIIDRKAPAKADLPQHVNLMFQRAGLKADPAATKTLINLVGDDLTSLNSAIAQLAAYKATDTDSVAGTEKPSGQILIPVTQREVAELVSETAEVKAWEFSDALAAKDVASALDILNRLTKSEGEGVQFLIVILAASKLRELLTARVLIERGEGSADVLLQQLQSQPSIAKSGKNRAIAPWLAQRIMKQAGHFRTEELREALRTLAEVEYTMKTSPSQLGRLALIRWVLQLQ